MKHIKYSHHDYMGFMFYIYPQYPHSYYKDDNICYNFLYRKYPYYMFKDMPETWADYIWNIIVKFIDILSIILEFISVLLSVLMIVGCWIFLIGKLLL